MKVSIIVAFCLIIGFSSCAIKKDNFYLYMAHDGRFDKKVVVCKYEAKYVQVLDSLISKIGKKGGYYYATGKKKNYSWEKIIVKEISNKPIDISIWHNTFVCCYKRRYSRDNILEKISISIKKNDKDFLKNFKFRNRRKTKRFLIDIAEKK